MCFATLTSGWARLAILFMKQYTNKKIINAHMGLSEVTEAKSICFNNSLYFFLYSIHSHLKFSHEMIYRQSVSKSNRQTDRQKNRFKFHRNAFHVRNKNCIGHHPSIEVSKYRMYMKFQRKKTTLIEFEKKNRTSLME